MEYTHPLDDPQGHFYLLKNQLGQLSLWPEACALPAGWAIVAPPRPHAECVAWLEQRGGDLHPAAYARGGAA
ncbi:MbtH family NRPS accessory protein [Enterobacter sp. Colony194]|uniref:MbtH family protein n=1 Tax=Enterobacter sp. Colony194 TaxID=2866201 RepID=UPI001C6972D4|nr:MbtH family NRPS accessory protein [Enterobacter sp. Colony194]